MVKEPCTEDGSDRTWIDAAELEVVETHISRVFLGPERVWKMKKPVDLGFLDFTSPEKRRQDCIAEVELNGRLAPGVYLGVVPVLARDGELRFGDEGCAISEGRGDGEDVEDAASDWAVLMRRLPDDHRVDLLLERDELSGSDVERIARRIARFHDETRCDETTRSFGAVEVVRGNVEENFRQTRDSLAEHLDREQAAEVEAWQLGFLEREAERFAQRIENGRVRDGHGDLRLEHVYLDVCHDVCRDVHALDDVVVVDCIEFNRRFRFADVCADVAFLAMDLTSRRRPDLAEAFLAAYARESQDYDLYPLVDFYESYRAFVRAKVASFVAHAESTPQALRQRKNEEAREHFLLALSSARRQLLPPRLVAVGGWIAAGKSTTSALVGRILDAPVVDADRTRKHLLEVSESERLYVEPWTGPYSGEMTERTYAELLRRAEQILLSRRSVVLDASFRLHRHRLDARQLAQRLGVPFLFVECRADAATCRRRLQARDPGPSDGRLEIFDDFVAAYERPEEVDAGDLLPDDDFLRLDTDRLSLETSEGRLLERLPSAPARLG